MARVDHLCPCRSRQRGSALLEWSCLHSRTAQWMNLFHEWRKRVQFLLPWWWISRSVRKPVDGANWATVHRGQLTRIIVERYKQCFRAVSVTWKALDPLVFAIGNAQKILKRSSHKKSLFLVVRYTEEYIWINLMVNPNQVFDERDRVWHEKLSGLGRVWRWIYKFRWELLLLDLLLFGFPNLATSFPSLLNFIIRLLQ